MPIIINIDKKNFDIYPKGNQLLPWYSTFNTAYMPAEVKNAFEASQIFNKNPSIENGIVLIQLLNNVCGSGAKNARIAADTLATELFNKTTNPGLKYLIASAMQGYCSEAQVQEKWQPVTLKLFNQGFIGLSLTSTKQLSPEMEQDLINLKVDGNVIDYVNTAKIANRS